MAGPSAIGSGDTVTVKFSDTYSITGTVELYVPSMDIWVILEGDTVHYVDTFYSMSKTTV